MACVTVTSLVRTLELEFLSYRPRPIMVENGLISVNKQLVESLCEKLQSLIEQLDEYKMDGVEAIKVLESKLRDVASRVEDEIEFQIVDLHVEKARPHLKFCQVFQTGKGKLHHILRQAMIDIKHIEDELVKVKNAIDKQGRNMELGILPKSDEVIMMGDSSQHASHFEDVMVGKHDEFETIMELLIQRAPRQQKVVSIKGMAGIGKTTLAKRVYDDSAIVSYFDLRAWVVASQNHNKRQMLIDLLKSMDSNAEIGSDADLALRLRQGLLGQRYLVVIDDIWSGEAWDDVKLCFPDDGNGSRVLLTTRLEEVVNYTHSNKEFSHQMRFLDQSESWNLFCEKVLLNGAEFETIARPIVEKCNGLPLAIVVVAGLFFKLNTLEEWKSVAKALDLSGTTTIAESCSRILSFSYNHLPYNLKACFLYLGVFPEDGVIRAGNLARLWAAEGLVKTLKDESFEVVAQKHIQDLFDRNLILLRRRSSDRRRIKAFRIHDVLHAFCVREAQNQNLLKVVGRNGLNFNEKDFHWLSIQSSNFDFQTLHSSTNNCRSIFFFSGAEAVVAKLNLQKFNVPRVFYLARSSPDYNRLAALGFSSVHLRYINDPCGIINLAQLSLCNNLHTLNSTCHNVMSHWLEFPHLCYCYSGSKDWGYPPKFAHQNIQSIKGINVCFCTKELFTKVPCLKKLCISWRRASTCTDCIGSIENLAHSQQLEILKIDGNRGCFYKFLEIPLLTTLKKLEFLYSDLLWEEVNFLSKLPRLEVLKLKSCKDDKNWTLGEGVKFCQLVSLELSLLDLESWEGNADNFPKLESLRIEQCDELKEIPICFAETSTLNSIEIRSCNLSLVNSAKQIQEEQHDQGNKNMVVIEEYTIKQKVVIKVERNGADAMKVIREFPGVKSVSLQVKFDEPVVRGDGIDTMELVRELRDKGWGAHILENTLYQHSATGAAEEEIEEEEEED